MIFAEEFAALLRAHYVAAATDGNLCAEGAYDAWHNVIDVSDPILIL